MAQRLLDAFSQYFSNGGEVLTDGQLRFCISGGSVSQLQDTFSDINLENPNPNPLPLEAGGRVPSCFGSDAYYKIRLEFTDGTLIQEFDPVGGPSSDGELSGWNNELVYNQNQTTYYSNRYWRSVDNGNQGNIPGTTDDWAEIKFIEQYLAGVEYPIHFIVQDSGIIYRSLQATNTGHTPASNPNWWERIGSIPIYSTAATYAQYDLVLSSGDEYQSLQNNNLNHAVTDSAWWVKRKQFEVWNSGKTYGSGDYAYDGEIRYISKQAANLNHQPSLDISETWWKPDWQAFDAFITVNTMSGGGTLKPYIPNMLTDGNAGYLLPLASTVPNKGWIAIAKSDIARTLYPIITASGADTIAWLAGTDTSFQIDTQFADSMILYSNGSNQWSF